jgi:SNF2 family DNA or RNA helicase
LHPHQIVGINWLRLIAASGVNGILADAMGLGKTITTLGTLSLLGELEARPGTPEATRAAEQRAQFAQRPRSKRQRNCPHLIIAPNSTLSNWEREIREWAGHLSLVVLYGTQGERQFLRTEVSSRLYAGRASDYYMPDAEDLQVMFRELQAQNVSAEAIAAYRAQLPDYRAPKEARRALKAGTPTSWLPPPVDIVLTTYSVAAGANQSDRAFFQSVQWGHVVLDEAQGIKNAASARYKHISRIKSNFRLLLTGTPLENSVDELLSLLTFIRPELSAAAAQIREEVAARTRRVQQLQRAAAKATSRGNSPIACQEPRGDEPDAAAAAEAAAAEIADGDTISYLRTVLEPFVLRRTKESIEASLPRKSVHVRAVVLGGEQAAAYRTTMAAGRAALLDNPNPGDERKHLMFLRKASAHTLLVPGARFSAIQRQQIAAVCLSSTSTMKLLSARCRLGLTASDVARLCQSAARRATDSAFSSPPSSRPGTPRGADTSDTDADSETEALGARAGSPAFIDDDDDDEDEAASTARHLDESDPVTMLMDELELCEPYRLDAVCRSVSRLSHLALPASDYLTGKVAALFSLIDLVAPRKVLVFSNFAMALDVVGMSLSLAGVSFLRFDGSTPAKERGAIISRFQHGRSAAALALDANPDFDAPDAVSTDDDTRAASARLMFGMLPAAPAPHTGEPRVLLTTTKAGGLGVTLTAATVVVFLDAAFNPAADAQAQDRVHRLGQTQPVDVYRLCAVLPPVGDPSAILPLGFDPLAPSAGFEATIDAAVMTSAGKKQELANLVMAGVGDSLRETLEDRVTVEANSVG